jgi:hypothetical protein
MDTGTPSPDVGPPGPTVERIYSAAANTRNNADNRGRYHERRGR